MANVPNDGVMRVQIRPMVHELAARVQRDRIPLVAAGVTYHWFLAVFPFLFAVVASITLAGRAVNQDLVLTTIKQVTPAGADEFLTQLVSSAQASTNPSSVLAIVLALALAVFSTSSGMAALLQGIEVAAEAPPRPFVRRRLVALALVLATLVLAGIGIALGIGADNVIGVDWLVTTIHRIIVVIVVVAVLAAISASRPTGQGLRRLWTVGSTFAAVATVVASLAMALFATRFRGSFAHTYGLFVNIVVLLFWFFAVSLAILVGAEIDAVRDRRLPAGISGMDPLHGKEDAMTPDTDTGTYRCDLCGETFGSEERLREHWDAEHATTLSIAATPRH